jgi:hypothetical protein
LDCYSSDNGEGLLHRRQETVIEALERRRREKISRKLRELRESAPGAQSSVATVPTSAAANSAVNTRRRRNLQEDNIEAMSEEEVGKSRAQVDNADVKQRPLPVFMPTIVPLHRVSSVSALQTAASMTSMRTRNGSNTNGNVLSPPVSGPMRANWSIGVPGVMSPTLSSGIDGERNLSSQPDR